MELTSNRVGTNAAGTAVLGNGQYGIRAISGRDVRIGLPGQGNVVSGNARGIAIEAGMRDVSLAGNTIGLDITRTVALGNGTWGGLDISAPGTRVGGLAPGAGNVIAGHAGSGIGIQGESAVGTMLQGNFIGTNPAGAAGLGNQVAGIQIWRAHGIQIGGTEAGAGNLIAHNRFNGILHRFGDGVSIQGNRIRDNDLLGIEIEPQGPTPNDLGDADGGVNFSQNFPVLGSAIVQGGQVTVLGVLDSAPLQDYLVEVVHSPACDPSGLGEGAESLGFVAVTTDAAGRASFSLQAPLATTEGVVAAKATATDGSTSEFSPCHLLAGPNPGSLQFWRSPFLSWEGQSHLLIGIVRSGGSAGAVSVQFSTVDGSAVAPQDYGAVSARIEFADGEVLKQVAVPIVADGVQEAQEQFRVRLSDPQGGASLGGQSQVDALIIDVGADFPMYFIDDVEVDLPASGPAMAQFTVTLTANSVPVVIDWTTSDATAVADEDYIASGGQLHFPPSATSQTRSISVPVLPGAQSGVPEIFYVSLSATGNIAVFKGLGVATLRRSVVAPGATLFANGFE